MRIVKILKQDNSVIIQEFPRRFLFVCVLICLVQTCVFTSVLFAQSLHTVPNTPSGWKKTTAGRTATVFSKMGLKKGQSLTVKFYQRQVLDTEQSIQGWLKIRMSTGKAPLSGKWSGAPTVVRQTGNMIEGTRHFEAVGKKYIVRGLAVGVDKVHVRFASAVSSHNISDSNNAAGVTLMYKLFRVEKEAAAKSSRGLNIEKTPPKVKNLKAGGAIKPGRYVGNAVYLRDNKVGAKYDLVLFDNGEFEFLVGGDKYRKTGRYLYSNATGRLNVGKTLANSTYRHDDEYCVYGKESTGKMVIYAREGRWQRKLTWISKSDRASPTEVKRADEIAEAEAKRYKHVTEPGEGVRTDEIESVLYVWETNYRSGAVQLDQEGFVLMKDGRVMDGLPTSPDTLDVAVSRSREPDRWGWWKKEEDNYTFAWPVRPREYRQPNGKQVIGVPFEKGTRLAGDFGMVSTETSLVSNYSSVRRWGIKLSDNGRFLKYRNGSTQSGGVPGMEAITTAVWSDDSTVISTLSPNATALSKRNRNGPKTDRMGSYELDGYRMTLKYDDGRVEHHATFTDEGQQNIWFEGARLYRRETKKK